MKDINSLEHTKWRCQYHVVFAPKYRCRTTIHIGQLRKNKIQKWTHRLQ
jgi:putative transposase